MIRVAMTSAEHYWEGSEMASIVGGRSNRMNAVGPFGIDLENYLLLRGKLRDELFDVCWDGAAVTPQALTNAIRELRGALRDDARQRYAHSKTPAKCSSAL